MTIAACLLAAASAAIEAPPSHDFGRIPNNRAVSASVEVGNPGPRRIEVVGVTSSCGCLRGRVEPRAIPPRGTARLLLDWDPRGKIGPNEKTVRIAYRESGATAQRVLRVRGEVYFAGKAGTIFEGDCNACHGLPASGKKGRALYDAVCADCHGATREGVPPSPPLPFSGLSERPPRAVFDAVYDGAWERGMPGFGLAVGGPLDADQVSSLVRLLRARPAPVSATARPAAARMLHGR